MGSRQPTEFELFLQKKRLEKVDGAKVVTIVTPDGAGQSPTQSPRVPLKLPSELRASFNLPDTSGASPERPARLKGGLAARASESLRRSAPELNPRGSAISRNAIGKAAKGGLAAATKGSAVGAVAADGNSDTPTDVVYGELATAAKSLANAAQRLARGSNSDTAVATSYETLAQAAADLAASACLIRPLTSSAAAAGGDSRPRSSAASPERRMGPLPPLLRSGSHASASPSAAALRAVDPVAAASRGSAAAAPGAATASGRLVVPQLTSAAAAAAPQSPSRSAAAAAAAASPSGRAAAAAAVATPKFPGYNPLIHLVQSELPLPGTSGSGSQRPPGSSPITHQYADAPRLPSTAAASASPRHTGPGSRRSGPSPLRTSAAAAPPLPPARLAPADLARLPVLRLDPDAAAAEFSGGAAGGEVREAQRLVLREGGEAVDPLAFLSPYADVRLAEWPPPEPVYVADMEQDELDQRYNKVLAALRERLHARGPARLAAAFRDLDPGGSGSLPRAAFLQVLRSLNLGAPELVDEKIVDLMLSAVAASAGDSPAAAASPTAAAAAAPAAAATPWPRAYPDRVPYGDFVSALRYGVLPWRGYNQKLRHRVRGDPDQPFGPPLPVACAPPYGVAYNGDGMAAAHEDAAAAARASLGAKWGDLRAAFRALDGAGEGVVGWPAFREAMRRVGDRYRLGLTDEELMQVYREADPDLATGVDYEAFMAVYGGAPAAAAAAAPGMKGSGSTAVPYLLPEFFQPKTLRCGRADRPWPQNWRQEVNARGHITIRSGQEAGGSGNGNGNGNGIGNAAGNVNADGGGKGQAGSAAGAGAEKAQARGQLRQAGGGAKGGNGSGSGSVASGARPGPEGPGSGPGSGSLSGAHAGAAAVLQRLSGGAAGGR
ncbi:hypothetical protein HYH03_014374 [Edaphochlamys debaryana]|uniref:EF-hand domain-containing protein n=1 Tax=Edaphochlamys debaryana TaxID=47281 RepID=A0A836BSC7_9CHLO|nr:hypothetical protein HYH03_014374 [Edaphochlamys debaryana]|eukprot:KAG2487002.1 hypothetical protein HYH03_014374 [Edaphochlamys debaryana]